MHNNNASILFIITNIYKYYLWKQPMWEHVTDFLSRFQNKSPVKKYRKRFPSTDTLNAHLIEMDTGRVDSSLKGKSN